MTQPRNPSGTRIRYDGQLIPAADAINRYHRDEKLQKKYSQAYQNVDDQQLTWEEVAERLTDR